MIHYNIAKGIEVNPFEGVTGFTISKHSIVNDMISHIINDEVHKPIVKYINGTWKLVYPMVLLDRVVLLSWIDVNRGVMKLKHKRTIHFSINDNILRMW